MRKALPLAFLAIASLALACGDAGSTSGVSRRGVPAPGDPQDHDPNSTDNSTDPGNPNANTPPPPPNNPGTTAGELGVALSTATPASDLGSKVDIDVTVTPKSGFTGAVALTVTGLPAGATGAFVPATVNLTTAPATSKLTITVPVTAVPSAPSASSAIVVTATAGTITATANANFKINPKALLTIPVNYDALRQAGVGTVYKDEWGSAFGVTQAPLKTQVGNGIVFEVYNADSVPHIVHGANGFAHGDTGNPIAPTSYEMQNGARRQRTLNPGANANGYAHEGANGPSASFRIAIQQAP